MNYYRSNTTYFLSEGKANLPECLRLSLKKASEAGIRSIVMFTTNGDGLEMACNKLQEMPEPQGIRFLGVSFPIGRAPQAALVLSEDRAKLLDKFEIQIIRAAMPFDDPGVKGISPRIATRRALECFSGGMALCISSAVIACDGGFIAPGSHIIAMSADTSIVVKAVPSSHMFSALAVREIICKPTILDITKKEVVGAEVNAEALLKRRRRTRALPPGSTDSKAE